MKIIEKLLKDYNIPFNKIRNQNKVELFLKKWRKIYSKKVKKETGNWIHYKLDWHTFSYDFHPSLKGPSASSAYEELYFKSYYILLIDEKIAYHCESNNHIPAKELLNLIITKSYRGDILVFHHNMRWTFYVTHEPEIGPFFSKKSI